MTIFIPNTRWSHGLCLALGFYGAAFAVADLGPPQPVYFVAGIRWWKGHTFEGGNRIEWRDYRESPATYRKPIFVEGAGHGQ